MVMIFIAFPSITIIVTVALWRTVHIHLRFETSQCEIYFSLWYCCS